MKNRLDGDAYDNWKLNNGYSDKDQCEGCCRHTNDMFSITALSGEIFYCKECHDELIIPGVLKWKIK